MHEEESKPDKIQATKEDILKLEGKELVDLLFKVENHNDPSAEPKRTSLKDLKLNNWWIFRRGCPNGDMYYELPDKHKKGETNTRKPEYIYTKLMCAKYDSCYVDSKSSCKECHKSEVDSLSSESTNLECITDAENTKIESISKLLSELDKTSDDNLEIDTNLVLSIKKPESEKMFTINLIRYKWDNDKLKLKEYSIDTKDKLDLYNTIYEHYTGSNKENADAHLLDYFQAKCTNCPDFKLTKTGDERYASTEAKQKHQEKSLSFLKKNEKLEKEKKQTYTNLKREVQAIKEKQKQLAEKQQQEEIKSAIIDQTISLAGKIGASGIKPLAEAFTKGKSSKINQISDDDFIPQLSNELVSGLPLSNIIASCESDIFKFIDHRNINDFNNVNEKLIELDEEKNNFKLNKKLQSNKINKAYDEINKDNIDDTYTFLEAEELNTSKLYADKVTSDQRKAIALTGVVVISGVAAHILSKIPPYADSTINIPHPDNPTKLVALDINKRQREKEQGHSSLDLRRPPNHIPSIVGIGASAALGLYTSDRMKSLTDHYTGSGIIGMNTKDSVKQHSEYFRLKLQTIILNIARLDSILELYFGYFQFIIHSKWQIFLDVKTTQFFNICIKKFNSIIQVCRTKLGWDNNYADSEDVNIINDISKQDWIDDITNKLYKTNSDIVELNKKNAMKMLYNLLGSQNDLISYLEKIINTIVPEITRLQIVIDNTCKKVIDYDSNTDILNIELSKASTETPNILPTLVKKRCQRIGLSILKKFHLITDTDWNILHNDCNNPISVLTKIQSAELDMPEKSELLKAFEPELPTSLDNEDSVCANRDNTYNIEWCKIEYKKKYYSLSTTHNLSSNTPNKSSISGDIDHKLRFQPLGNLLNILWGNLMRDSKDTLNFDEAVKHLQYSHKNWHKLSHIEVLNEIKEEVNLNELEDHLNKSFADRIELELRHENYYCAKILLYLLYLGYSEHSKNRYITDITYTYDQIIRYNNIGVEPDQTDTVLAINDGLISKDINIGDKIIGASIVTNDGLTTPYKLRDKSGGNSWIKLANKNDTIKFQVERIKRIKPHLKVNKIIARNILNLLYGISSFELMGSNHTYGDSNFHINPEYEQNQLEKKHKERQSNLNSIGKLETNEDIIRQAIDETNSSDTPLINKILGLNHDNELKREYLHRLQNEYKEKSESTQKGGNIQKGGRFNFGYRLSLADHFSYAKYTGKSLSFFSNVFDELTKTTQESNSLHNMDGVNFYEFGKTSSLENTDRFIPNQENTINNTIQHKIFYNNFKYIRDSEFKDCLLKFPLLNLITFIKPEEIVKGKDINDILQYFSNEDLDREIPYFQYTEKNISSDNPNKVQPVHRVEISLNKTEKENITFNNGDDILDDILEKSPNIKVPPILYSSNKFLDDHKIFIGSKLIKTPKKDEQDNIYIFDVPEKSEIRRYNMESTNISIKSILVYLQREIRKLLLPSAIIDLTHHNNNRLKFIKNKQPKLSTKTTNWENTELENISLLQLIKEGSLYRENTSFLWRILNVDSNTYQLPYKRGYGNFSEMHKKIKNHIFHTKSGDEYIKLLSNRHSIKKSQSNSTPDFYTTTPLDLARSIYKMSSKNRDKKQDKLYKGFTVPNPFKSTYKNPNIIMEKIKNDCDLDTIGDKTWQENKQCSKYIQDLSTGIPNFSKLFTYKYEGFIKYFTIMTICRNVYNTTGDLFVHSDSNSIPNIEYEIYCDEPLSQCDEPPRKDMFNNKYCHPVCRLNNTTNMCIDNGPNISAAPTSKKLIKSMYNLFHRGGDGDIKTTHQIKGIDQFDISKAFPYAVHNIQENQYMPKIKKGIITFGKYMGISIGVTAALPIGIAAAAVYSALDLSSFSAGLVMNVLGRIGPLHETKLTELGMSISNSTKIIPLVSKKNGVELDKFEFSYGEEKNHNKSMELLHNTFTEEISKEMSAILLEQLSIRDKCNLKNNICLEDHLDNCNQKIEDCIDKHDNYCYNNNYSDKSIIQLEELIGKCETCSNKSETCSMYNRCLMESIEGKRIAHTPGILARWLWYSWHTQKKYRVERTEKVLQTKYKMALEQLEQSCLDHVNKCLKKTPDSNTYTKEAITMDCPNNPLNKNLQSGNEIEHDRMEQTVFKDWEQSQPKFFNQKKTCKLYNSTKIDPERCYDLNIKYRCNDKPKLKDQPEDIKYLDNMKSYKQLCPAVCNSCNTYDSEILLRNNYFEDNEYNLNNIGSQNNLSDKWQLEWDWTIKKPFYRHKVTKSKYYVTKDELLQFPSDIPKLNISINPVIDFEDTKIFTEVINKATGDLSQAGRKIINYLGLEICNIKIISKNEIILNPNVQKTANIWQHKINQTQILPSQSGGGTDNSLFYLGFNINEHSILGKHISEKISSVLNNIESKTMYGSGADKIYDWDNSQYDLINHTLQKEISKFNIIFNGIKQIVQIVQIVQTHQKYSNQEYINGSPNENNDFPLTFGSDTLESNLDNISASESNSLSSNNQRIKTIIESAKEVEKEKILSGKIEFNNYSSLSNHNLYLDISIGKLRDMYNLIPIICCKKIQKKRGRFSGNEIYSLIKDYNFDCGMPSNIKINSNEFISLDRIESLKPSVGKKIYEDYIKSLEINDLFGNPIIQKNDKLNYIINEDDEFSSLLKGDIIFYINDTKANISKTELDSILKSNDFISLIVLRKSNLSPLLTKRIDLIENDETLHPEKEIPRYLKRNPDITENILEIKINKDLYDDGNFFDNKLRSLPLSFRHRYTKEKPQMYISKDNHLILTNLSTDIKQQSLGTKIFTAMKQKLGSQMPKISETDHFSVILHKIYSLDPRVIRKKSGYIYAKHCIPLQKLYDSTNNIFTSNHRDISDEEFKTNYKKLYNTITTTNKKPWYSVINAIFNNNYKNLDSKITDNKIISKLNKTKPQVEDRLIREAPAEYCTDQCKNSVKEGSCHWQYNNNFKIHVEYLTNDTKEDYLDLNKLDPYNILSGRNIELNKTNQEKSNNQIYGGYSQISKKNRRKQRSKLRGKRYNVGGYSKIKNRNRNKSRLNKKRYIKKIKSITNH